MAFATYRHVRPQVGTSESPVGTYVWDGSAGDGLWSTAANWTPSGPPGAGDTAIIAATDDDIDQDTSGLGVKYLCIGPGHTGNITSSYTLAANQVHIRKRVGNVELNTGSQVGRSVIENLYVYQTSGGTDSLTVGGKYKNVVILSGVVRFTSLLTRLDSLYVIPPGNRTANVTLEADSTFGDVWMHQNAFVTSSSGFDDVDIWGRAQLTVTGVRAIDTLTTSGTVLVRWKSANNITRWYGYGGTVAFKGNTTTGVEISTVDLYSEAVLDLRTGVDAPQEFALSNNHYGGVIRLDEGRTLAVS